MNVHLKTLWKAFSETGSSLAQNFSLTLNFSQNIFGKDADHHKQCTPPERIIDSHPEISLRLVLNREGFFISEITRPRTRLTPRPSGFDLTFQRCHCETLIWSCFLLNLIEGISAAGYPAICFGNTIIPRVSHWRQATPRRVTSMALKRFLKPAKEPSFPPQL